MLEEVDVVLTASDVSRLALAVCSLNVLKKKHPGKAAELLESIKNPYAKAIFLDLMGAQKLEATKGLLRWRDALGTVHAPRRC